MVLSFTDDFRITWRDPSDAELTWRNSKDHFARPLTPLAQGVVARLFPPGRTIFINGYMYSAPPATPQPPGADLVERGGAAVWLEDYEPRSRGICARIRRANYEAMTTSDLLAVLDSCIEGADEVCRYTMAVVADFRRPGFQLLDFCRQELGEDGPALAAVLLQGFENPSAGAGAALARLAELASGSPQVAQSLREGRFKGLENLAESRDFIQELRAFLDEFGWRAEEFGEFHRPTWAEDPELALEAIARYVADPGRSPAQSLSRSRVQREEAVREVEGRLPDSKVPEFRALLAAAQAHVPINEGRNFWQLTVIGLVRLPCIALGRRLVGAGALLDPNDIFFLHIDELPDVTANPASEMKGLAARRKIEFERWHSLTPPPFLGKAPDPTVPQAQQPPAVRYVRYAADGVSEHVAEGNEIKGIGASRGIVRGTARVIRGLEQAGHLQPGEILVCVTTAPPWTPLFAIAGGVVTDTGGILSHSAICAREYAVPCVVGTGIATARIPDGAQITVDGSRGTVTLEG